MKQNIVLIGAILLLVPQAIIHAEEMKPNNPPQNGGQMMPPPQGDMRGQRNMMGHGDQENKGGMMQQGNMM